MFWASHCPQEVYVLRRSQIGISAGHEDLVLLQCIAGAYLHDMSNEEEANKESFPCVNTGKPAAIQWC